MRSEKQESCRWLKFWSSDTPSNYNPNSLPGALFFYTTLRPLNPSHPALLIRGPVSRFFPVNQTGCCSDVETLCRRTNQPLGLLGTWWMKNSSSQTHSNTLQMMNNYSWYYLPRRRFSQRLETRSFSSTSKKYSVSFCEVSEDPPIKPGLLYGIYYFFNVIYFSLNQGIYCGMTREITYGQNACFISSEW